MPVRAEQLEAQLAKSLAALYVIHGDEPLLALEAAVEGVGIVATLPELARPQLDDGRLVAPFGLRVELPYAYFLVAREEALARASVQTFLAWLRGQAADAR